MNEHSFDMAIRRAFPGIEAKKSWVVAKELWGMCCEYSDQVVRANAAEEKAKANKLAAEKKAAGGTGLSDEERIDALKGILDRHLIAGELPEQFKEFSSIFGFRAVSDPVTLEVINFKDAYKDYAEAIRLGERPIEACYETGGKE